MYKSRDERKRAELIRSFSTVPHPVIQLSDNQVDTIKGSDLLSTSEKLQLLAISLGYRFTTEINSAIKYYWDEEGSIFLPEKQKLETTERLLKSLPFPFFLDTVTKNSRKTSGLTQIIWFQICLNQNVADFIKHFYDDLSSIELGILYGYPATSVAAFHGFLELEKAQPATDAQKYLGGLLSVPYKEQELNWYNTILEAIDHKYNVIDSLLDGAKLRPKPH